MKEYNKLVRNRIPEIITGDNKKPITHIASEKEFENALVDKLTEEVNEYKSSGDLEELVDIMEVVEAIGYLKGVSLGELNKLKRKKANKRGSFSKRIILERVE